MPRYPKKNVDKRAEYIKKQLAKTQNITKGVKKISEKLFISERQVWRDLQK
jgi:hypothetical protein